MPTVSTLRGEVDVDELGPTLMHEHLFVITADRVLDDPGSFDVEARVADAVQRLNALYDVGVRTIVDPTVIGLGRDIRLWTQVAEQAPVNVVPATGFYTYRDLPFGFRFRSDDELVAWCVRDLTEGIGGTSVRAAFLKCAVDYGGFEGDVERVLRSVARASLETGAPLTVHTHAQRQGGREVQRVLKEEGVDLRSVVIGHSGDSDDLGYLMELADAGSMLGMDRFGLDMLLPFEKRVATVAALCARGYAGRMVLSHDASCHTDWFPHDLIDPGGRWHFTHIHDEVLPALQAAGVTAADIDTMLVHNPRRYFGGSPS